MDEFTAHLKAVQKVTLFFLSFCLFAWAFLPDYRPYSLGLVVGVSVSYLNAQYLALKLRQLTKAVVEKTNRRVNLGFITRAATSLLTVVIVVKNPDKIALSTTLAGLFIVQLVTLLLGIVSNARRK
ncbi:ATP synthase subunit I [Paenibacillus koleovorans]|uniref:ATP synthase subunit I n=1 Tax=Paenibacillus koleovorans TaxID=121608 RepID=UPI000FDB8550|nr:ATP synthase subunit I [Paenibacillus koleovorans]